MSDAFMVKIYSVLVLCLNYFVKGKKVSLFLMAGSHRCSWVE